MLLYGGRLTRYLYFTIGQTELFHDRSQDHAHFINPLFDLSIETMMTTTLLRQANTL